MPKCCCDFDTVLTLFKYCFNTVLIIFICFNNVLLNANLINNNNISANQYPHNPLCVQESVFEKNERCYDVCL